MEEHLLVFDVIHRFEVNESLRPAQMEEDLLVFDVIYCLDG